MVQGGIEHQPLQAAVMNRHRRLSVPRFSCIACIANCISALLEPAAEAISPPSQPRPAAFQARPEMQQWQHLCRAWFHPDVSTVQCWWDRLARTCSRVANVSISFCTARVPCVFSAAVTSRSCSAARWSTCTAGKGRHCQTPCEGQAATVCSTLLTLRSRQGSQQWGTRCRSALLYSHNPTGRQDELI